MNEIVSTCQFRDGVYIFCRNGDIYRMDIDELTGQLMFSKQYELFHP